KRRLLFPLQRSVRVTICDRNAPHHPGLRARPSLLPPHRGYLRLFGRGRRALPVAVAAADAGLVPPAQHRRTDRPPRRKVAAGPPAPAPQARPGRAQAAARHSPGRCLARPPRAAGPWLADPAASADGETRPAHRADAGGPRYHRAVRRRAAGRPAAAPAVPDVRHPRAGLYRAAPAPEAAAQAQAAQTRATALRRAFAEPMALRAAAPAIAGARSAPPQAARLSVTAADGITRDRIPTGRIAGSIVMPAAWHNAFFL